MLLGVNRITSYNVCYTKLLRVRAKKDVKKWFDLTAVDITMEKVLTEDMKTIEEVSNFLSVPKAQTIKAVIKKAIYEDTQEIVVFFVRGDDELEETKATNAVDCLELIDRITSYNVCYTKLLRL